MNNSKRLDRYTQDEASAILKFISLMQLQEIQRERAACYAYQAGRNDVIEDMKRNALDLLNDNIKL